MKKNIIKLVLITFLFIPLMNAKATTLRDLYNELNALENSYSKAQNKANMTSAELARVQSSIASTEQEIKQTSAEIQQAEKDIVDSEKKIEEKKEETNQMLLYLQVNNAGGNSLVEYIFQADDYTDFIYRYSVVSQMTNYNEGLMNELNQLIDELNTKKQNLATKQTELAAKKSELQSKYALVQVQLKSDKEEGLSIADQISEKRKVVNYYKKICSMDQDINTCSGSLAVDGWTYPLSHFRQSSIYAEARGSKKHYAVDLAVAEGSNVYAVANGTVISAKGSSCGGMVIQIRHNYNGSNYVSLYMHLIEGYVKVNQNVTKGQVIGTSGGGPKEIAVWGDTCTEGAHLHFSMSQGASMIGYSSQAGSTFDPVRFFPAMKGYGASI